MVISYHDSYIVMPLEKLKIHAWKVSENSEVLFHLRVIASAADCAIVHQYITWYCLYQLQVLDLTCNVTQ